MSSYKSTESSSTRMCRRWRMRWSRSSPARRTATRSMRALTLPKSRMGLWSNTCAPYTDSEWKMVVTPCDTSSRSALYSDVDRSMTTLGRGEATFST